MDRNLKIEKRYSVHTLVSYESDLLQFDNYLTSVYDSVSFSSVEMLHVRSYMVELLELQLAKSSGNPENPKNRTKIKTPQMIENIIATNFAVSIKAALRAVNFTLL